MAPKALKRPAAATETTSPTKRSKTDVVKEQCSLVSAALDEAEDIPRRARDMLQSCVLGSLGVLRDQRHPFQEKAVEMVGTALSSIEAGVQRRTEELQAKVNGADAERAGRDAALVAAKSALEAKVDATRERKESLSQLQAAFKEAGEAVTDALVVQEQGDSELAAAGCKKEALEVAVKDLYTPLKEGSVESGKDAKKNLTSLLAQGKKFDFDASMLGALSTALGKALAQRGTFDAIVLKQFEDAVAQKISSLDALIVEGEPAKAERAAAVQAAEAARDAAEAKRAEGATELKAAQAEQKECDEALKAAQKAVDDFVPELEAITAEYEAEQTRLVAFREGPLTAFGELETRSTPEPPKEDVEVQEQAEVTVEAVEVHEQVEVTVKAVEVHEQVEVTLMTQTVGGA